MKTLLILRHAKSSWKETGLSDLERPLNKRGNRQVPAMGQLIREEGLTPDLIISSPATRARTTAETVAQGCGYEETVEIEPDFYLGAPDDYIRALRRVPEPARIVMVVGHNPGLEDLLETLAGELQPLSTAALAQVMLPLDGWKELSVSIEGKLVNLWRPPE